MIFLDQATLHLYHQREPVNQQQIKRIPFMIPATIPNWIPVPIIH